MFEYKEKECYIINIENIDLTTYKSPTKSVIKMFKICLFNEITIYDVVRMTVCLISMVLGSRHTE